MNAARIIPLVAMLGITAQQGVQYMRVCDGRTCRLVPVNVVESQVVVESPPHGQGFQAVPPPPPVDPPAPDPIPDPQPALAPIVVSDCPECVQAAPTVVYSTAPVYHEAAVVHYRGFAERRPVAAAVARGGCRVVRAAVRIPARVVGRIVFGRRR